MKSRLIRYGACLANTLLLAALTVLLFETYGDKKLVVLLMFIPPLLSLIALRQGPDAEEIDLTRQLNKARLRAELEKLTAEKKP